MASVNEPKKFLRKTKVGNPKMLTLEELTTELWKF